MPCQQLQLCQVPLVTEHCSLLLLLLLLLQSLDCQPCFPQQWLPVVAQQQQQQRRPQLLSSPACQMQQQLQVWHPAWQEQVTPWQCCSEGCCPHPAAAAVPALVALPAPRRWQGALAAAAAARGLHQRLLQPLHQRLLLHQELLHLRQLLC
jgi:hypothetical protein